MAEIDFIPDTAETPAIDFVPDETNVAVDFIPESAPVQPARETITTIGPAKPENIFSKAARGVREFLSPLIGQTEEQIQEDMIHLGINPAKVTSEQLLEMFPSRGPRQLGVVASQPMPDKKAERMTAEEMREKGFTDQKSAEVAAGLQNATANLIDFLRSPMGVATLGIGALPKLAQQIAAVGFGAMVGKEIPHLVTEFKKAREEGNNQKAAELAATGVGAVLGATVGATQVPAVARAARSAISKPVQNTLIPETTRAVQAIPEKALEVTPVVPTTAEDAITQIAALPDESRIAIKVKEQDVMPGRDYFASPEFEFRKNPVAKELVTDLVEADLGYRGKVAETDARFQQIASALTVDQQKRVMTVLKEVEAGDKSALAKLSEPERALASEVRGYFDQVKGRIIDEKKVAILSSMTGPEQNAVNQILSGVSEAEAFAANKLREAGKMAVRATVDEVKALDKWGPEDYVTHIERGSYRVVDPTGTTVAIGQTRADAARKAKVYLDENPDVKQLTIDDEFSPNVEFPTKLSRGQYFRMISRMSDELGEDAAVIQDLLKSEGNIVAIKPTNKYAGALQQRRDILKGEENIMDALPAYVHSVEKKLALDPVLRQARTVLPNLPPNMRGQIEELITAVKGRKTLGDDVADYLLSPLGTKPFAYSRGVDVARNITANLKLGYRPLSALINRLGGAMHTWVKSGTSDFIEGRRFSKTKEFEDIWKRNSAMVGADPSFGIEGSSSKTAPWKPMAMFQFAEKVNRPESFATFYQHAKNKLGMDSAAAERFAREETRFAQFAYNTASLPRLMRSPSGRLAFQFKPYLVKEMEFISQLTPEQAVRYTAAFLAMGGPKSALYLMRSLPVLGVLGVWNKIEDWMNQNAPEASRGIGGLAGVDVTAAVTPQLPTRPEDIMGPTLSDLDRLYKTVVSPALKGEKIDFNDIKEWGVRLAPAMFYWEQLVDAASHPAGWITNERGEPVFKPEGADFAKLAMGMKPLEQSVQELDLRMLRESERVLRENRKSLIDDYLNAFDKQDGAEMDSIIQKFHDFGITDRMVQDQAKDRNIGPRERLRKSLSRLTREQNVEKITPQQP